MNFEVGLRLIGDSFRGLAPDLCDCMCYTVGHIKQKNALEHAQNHRSR